MRRLFHWMTDSLARTTFSLVALGLIAFAGVGAVRAATTYEVNNLPVMYLRQGITATQTGVGSESDIQLIAPTRNLQSVTIPAMSGAIFELRNENSVESIYVSRVMVNQTTQVVTFTGSIIRDLSWNNCQSFTSNGHGVAFGKGAEVRLADDCRLFNFKANTDRANTFKALQSFGSGVDIIGVRRPLKLSSYTTAERDALTPETGFQIINTTSGVEQTYYGGAWNSAGVATIFNASITIAGKAQAATDAMLRALTDTGSTGALNFLTPTNTVKNGSGSTSAGKVVQTNSRGAVSATLGGTGSGGTKGLGSGALLLGNGSGAIKGLYPGTGVNVPVSSGGRWGVSTLTGASVPVVVSRRFQTYTRAMTASELLNLSGSYLIPAGTATVGQSYEILERLTVNANGTTDALKLNVGSNAITIMASQNSTNANLVFVKCSVMFTAVGAGGAFGYDCEVRYNGVTTRTSSTTATSIDTTAAQLIRFSYLGGGGGSAPTVVEYESVYSRY